ncbi:MAG: efflux RND transporter periplasmic adaptor subunit [Gammaproteobacteria bacterium]|jgi:RND family efflux transporter MFP subunit|nr:efflux RND transporter periplasmic adaptor subunit [Gammaproteobacteria bacterium]
MDDFKTRGASLRDRLLSTPASIRWVCGIIALLVVVGLLRTRLASTPVSGPSLPPLVTASPVKVAEIADLVNITGTLGAREEAAISSEGESGRIAAVLVEIGDRVRAGQVLARLDTATIAPAVGSLQAQLEEARANSAVAESDYRRAQAVAAIGALSQQDIDKRRASAVAAEARVKVVAAQLNEATARLRRTEIRAPFDGLVLTRAAEVGQLSSPGAAPLFRIGRAGAIEMRGNVAEADLPRLRVGQLAVVTVTGVAREFRGSVRLIGAVIDGQTRLGSVRVALTPDPDLRPGAFARGRVEVGKGRRSMVPQTAILSDLDGNYVYVVDPQGVVQRRNVNVAQSRPEGVVIASGLADGERVVSTAGAYLRPGEKVRLAKE